MKPTVLFLFNSSSYAVQPWLDDGRFNVVSVDYDDTDHSGAHKEPCEGHTVFNLDLSQPYAAFNVMALLRSKGYAKPSICISFTPCTDLAVSGAAHFAKKREVNPDFQRDALQLALIATEFDCPYMVENPVSVLATMWRKPDMYWHPYEFGYLCPEGEHPEFPGIIPERDLYPKKTGLWAGNGFGLPLTVQPPASMMEDVTAFYGHTKLGGKSARTKYIRSLTPRGFAMAIYLANVSQLIGGEEI